VLTSEVLDMGVMTAQIVGVDDGYVVVELGIGRPCKTTFSCTWLASVPAAFAGAPIAFVTAGLLAMAFMGFAGLI